MSSSSDTELEYPPPAFKKPKIHFPPISEAQIYNYKTQLCRRFRLGICTQGSRCSYAHSVGELRRRREIVGGGDSTRVCRMFAQGRQCPYGNTCRFPHIRNEGAVNSREMSIVEVIPSIRNSESDRLEFKNVLNSEGFGGAEVNKKTELLKIKRVCSSGNICRFAHGQAVANAELLGKPDSCLTSECGVMQTSSTATTDASIRVVQTGSLLKKESYSLNFKFKRNELHRISRIYADWI